MFFDTCDLRSISYGIFVMDFKTEYEKTPEGIERMPSGENHSDLLLFTL